MVFGGRDPDGFVLTPDDIVDSMVARLFRDHPPTARSAILDPGCGDGALIAGIIRWCASHHVDIPRITGVEKNVARAIEARKRFRSYPSIRIEWRDFLTPSEKTYDYILGNPPYISLLRIPDADLSAFRTRYRSARGRFDAYMLFFEQAITMLKENGRMVFITPEKYLYVHAGTELRTILARYDVHEIALVHEKAFRGMTTYPAITTIDHPGEPPSVPIPRMTTFIDRSGSRRQFQFPIDGTSVAPLMRGWPISPSERTLGDLCTRISCGIATGADEVYVRRTEALPDDLRPFSYPTISGRQMSHLAAIPVPTRTVFILPYDRYGKLLPFSHLGPMMAELERHKGRLLRRACARRKPWYAIHDAVPLDAILRPKILCADIVHEPKFIADYDGIIVPRHSTYYMVLKDPTMLDAIIQYLSGPEAAGWLRAHCQPAANGYMRLQSSVLKNIPIPNEIGNPPSSGK